MKKTIMKRNYINLIKNRIRKIKNKKNGEITSIFSFI